MKPSCLAATVSLVVLAGCAGQNVRLTDAHRKTLTTEQVHAVHVVPTGFAVESTGYTLAGVFLTPLVAIGQAAEGMSISAGLEDPAVRVKERLLAELERNYRLPNVVRVAQPVSRFSQDKENYKGLQGLVLEVRTTKWGVDNARAKYAAGARVLRLSDGEILWDATCDDVIAEKNAPSPGLDVLRANNAALLRLKLNQAADQCADQLVAWAIERAESR